MKKKLLFLVPLISTSMVLTACGGLGGGGEGGNGISLPNTAEQAVNMFYQFASNTGVEITYRVYDDESAQPETNTIGFKNDVFWVKESVAYKKVGTTLESYEYDASKRSYEFQAAVAESGQYSLDYFLKSLTTVFYAGYDYASGSVSAAITAKKDVTFLTRAATEYTFSASAGSATATLNIVFDNATGITLKIYGSATGGGDNSSAEYEVTSFAVGDAVTVPTLNKSSGQGGEGQGGEGQGGEGGGGQTDVDVFSNKLLMYVSNESANVYANSQLGLFADGKFELSFMQNGYQVVIFGNYTVASNKTTATLVTTQVYKDQGKQTSPMNETWVLNFANNAYALKVSNNGTVNYNASGTAPTHYVIPGEGGQTGDVENFVNHAFVYVDQQNAPNFVNSSIALFDDDTFEVVTTQNGSLVVYIGTYTVNSSDTAATLSVQKYYSAASGQYVTQAVGNWLLTLQQNNYMLSMAGGPTVYYCLSSEAPVHADIPADEGQGQTGDDAKYKVNEATWNEMIVNRGLISLTSNFTMVTSDASGQTKYEFDSGKVHYTFASSSFTNEMFYEFTSLSSGTFYYKNEGKWEKQDAPADMHLTFDDYIGVLPVPYSKVSFNSTSYYYGCNEWKDEQQDAYQNPRFYFEEGNLIKTTYKHWNVDYEYNFNAYGTTSVTLPEVSGGGSQTDDNARYKITATLWENLIIDGGLVDLDSNFTAMVTTSDNQRGYTKYEFDEGNIRVYTVDADGTTSEDYFEYENAQSGYMYSIGLAGVWTRETYRYGIGSFFNSLGVLQIEFSNLTFNETTHEYDLRSWTNGSGNQFTDIHFSFDNNKLMKMRYSGQLASREVEFNKYGATSVTLPEVGGGQQQTSKWPAEDIATKLEQLDLAVSIPAPSVADESIDSVSVNIPADNSGLSIVITLTDTNNIGQLVYGYMGGFTGFEADYYSSEFSEDGYSGTYALINETRDIIIKLTYDLNSPVFSIFVAKFTGNPYPADKIAAFFNELELEVSFPDLSMNDVSYSFMSSAEEGFGMLMMTPMGDNTTEAIVSYVETALSRSEFSAVYEYYDEGDESELYATYLDPTLAYTVGFYENDGQVYLNININEEDPTEYISFDYPQEQIEALIPEDFDGIIPSFETRGAVYRVEEIDGGFNLQISLQSGMNASAVMRTLANALTGEQYALNNDGGYESQDGQVVVFLNNIENKLITVEVYFLEQEEPPIEEPIEVSYSLVWDKGNWGDDITAADAKIYAYIWGGEEGDQWIELEPIFNEDGTISFNLDITSDYTGVKIVRFAPDSELGWEGDEGVKIWNQSGDYELNGKGGEIHFVVAQ